MNYNNKMAQVLISSSGIARIKRCLGTVGIDNTVKLYIGRLHIAIFLTIMAYTIHIAIKQ